MSNDIELHPRHLEIINNIAKKEDFVDYEVELSSGTEKGDNFLSYVYFATLKEKNTNKSLDLVLKLASNKELIRNYVKFITTGFIREIYLYEKIFPSFLHYQNSHNVPDKFETIAKEYASDATYPNEIVVFENLKSKGFTLCNRRETMDSEHVYLVLKNYAKFHAISFAMSTLNNKQFEELTEGMDNVWIPDTQELFDLNGKYFDACFKMAEEALEGFEAETKALKKFRENLKNVLLNELSPRSEDDLVVTHGDCWCNNMMFKYEDAENPGKPTKVCMIDLQISRRGSPTHDLAYFLFCSVSGKDLSKNIDNYLRSYHIELAKSLRYYGCDVETIFPYSLLEKHWKKYSKFGIYTAVILMKMFMQDPDETQNLDDIKEGEQEEIITTIKNLDQYRERMRNVMSFAVERKYI